MRLRYFLCALCAAFTLNAGAAIPASEQAVAVEFYHATLDHYFITADPKEINDLDTGVHKGWTRTGYRFSVMKGGSSYAGTSPVCRFYSPTLDTHFYSAKKSECDEVKEKFGNIWTFEADEVFRAFVVDPETGVCGADTTPTYRLYNNRPDANHRYTDQVSVFVFMKGSKSYIPEGDGNPSLPIVFCTPSGGDVVPVANESAPNCTVTANNSTPAVGGTLDLNATCTNEPTTFMWQGCTSTTNSCKATKSAPGSQSYTLYAANASGPADPVTLTVNWGGGNGGGGGAVPICQMAANTIGPTTGQTVTLTASCNNAPASYEWVECSYLVQSICNAIPTCSSTAPTCNVTQSVAGYTRHGVGGKNASGSGPKVFIDMYWTGSGGGNPPPGGGAQTPVCNIAASNHSPATGSTITLTANCSGSPSSYDWIGEGLVGNCASSSTCQATWNVAQSVTYGVSGINGVGTGGRAYTGVNWQQVGPVVPNCTITPSSTTPQVGAQITITASCTNSPTSFTWTGCTSTTSSCTDSATAPGVKNYQLVATNAAGNSPVAQTNVNWQPPPTAAPTCTVATSNASPYTGQNITLTATCDQSPTSYAWSGCTSTTSTCTTTSSTEGSVTYGVAASNAQFGAGAQATVQVNWQKQTGGVNYCGANTTIIDIPWGSTTRYETIANGGFPQGKMFVFSITIPASQTPKRFDGYFAPAEYKGGGTALRTMSLSENLCDFTTYIDAASGLAPFIYFDVGTPARVQAGKTYYFSLKNENCPPGVSCDMSVTVQWPHD